MYNIKKNKMDVQKILVAVKDIIEVIIDVIASSKK